MMDDDNNFKPFQGLSPFRLPLDRLRRIRESGAKTIAELVEIAELDPKRDFRHVDLRGVDWQGTARSQFDLTGAQTSPLPTNYIVLLSEDEIKSRLESRKSLYEVFGYTTELKTIIEDLTNTNAELNSSNWLIETAMECDKRVARSQKFGPDQRTYDTRRDRAIAVLARVGIGLPEATLCGAKLRGAKLRDARLLAANLKDSDLEGSNLELSHLQRADLRNANLEGANLKYADLKDANLAGANLRNADLSDAALTRSNLQGAILAWANLSRSNLKRADLRGSDVKGANLSDADLKHAKFTSHPKELDMFWMEEYPPQNLDKIFID